MSHAKSSLAIMQADMDTALQIKEDTGAKVASAASSEQAATLCNMASLTQAQASRVIEMAWEDRTPFAAIAHSYGLNEAGVIKLMRQTLKPSSYRLWRKRVSGRRTKHLVKRGFEVGRAYCKTQYKPR